MAVLVGQGLVIVWPSHTKCMHHTKRSSRYLLLASTELASPPNQNSDSTLPISTKQPRKGIWINASSLTSFRFRHTPRPLGFSGTQQLPLRSSGRRPRPLGRYCKSPSSSSNGSLTTPTPSSEQESKTVPEKPYSTLLDIINITTNFPTGLNWSLLDLGIAVAPGQSGIFSLLAAKSTNSGSVSRQDSGRPTNHQHVYRSSSNGSLVPSSTIPEELTVIIQAYLDKHPDIDDGDSQRLHDELMHLYTTKVGGHPDRHATFLSSFRGLRPALTGVDRLMAWWDIMVRPTLDSLGQAKAVVGDARAIVLSVLVYDEDDDRTGEKAKAAALFTEKLFEVYLEKSKVSTENTGFADEEKQRFVVSNVEAVLLAYGKRKPKAFMEHIDHYVVQKEHRLQVLGLLCSFVQLQGPHLYQVLRTPLMEHLLQCLQIDTSTTVISLALTILIMFMPHICNSLAPYLPQLFFIYTRVLCWDKYGIVRFEELRWPTPSGGKETHRADSPVSGKEDSAGNIWHKLDSSFETATSTTPDVSYFFTFLYGLYPINFVTFIREPYKFLESSDFKDIEDLDLDEETIKIRTEQYRQRHTLHPNFLTLTREAELADQTRWMKFEPADVTALCNGLVNSNIQLSPEDEAHLDQQLYKSYLPGVLVPTEDIPSESLLSSGEDHLPVDDEFTSLYTNDSGYGWKEPGQAPRSTKISGDSALIHRKSSPFHRSHASSPAIKGQDSKVPDSPTLPVHTGRPSIENARVQNMLQLQESLRTDLQGNHIHRNEFNATISHGNNGLASVTASPRLEAYVHSLSQNTIPRSPAVRPATSDTQATNAFLQREVMLLKNDLNFERYLKQQHLSHIGHLQRKHIKESAAEAETQKLIYTNKALKAKIEEAKKTHARSKAEALAQKNQSKKWEAELNAKIRALREEQRIWKAEEEAVKKALEIAQKDVQHLRRLIAESESKELLSRQRNKILEDHKEQLDRLKEENERLEKKLKVYEAKLEEYEDAKHNEETAVAQSDMIKLRLQSQQQEKERMKRAYEQKVADLEQRLGSTPPSPSMPGPGIQAMIDSALQSSNQRIAALKKAHQILLTKYTELEIRYIELQANQELDYLPTSGHSGHNQQFRDSSFSSQNGDGNAPDERYQRPSYSRQAHHFQSESSEAVSPTELPGHHHNSYFQTPNLQRPGSQQRSPTTPHMYSPNVGYASMNYQYKSPNPPPITPLPPTPGQYREERPALRAASTISEPQDITPLRPMPSMPEGSEDGGVQNIGKKEKEKKEEKVKEEGKRRLRFPTGSGLAGIRGFH
ncbi:Hamartin protein-domain-containing protein [Peziza echinospora]|nr:Hamartin protein-domain-containing protein [Peziza echinospora]